MIVLLALALTCDPALAALFTPLHPESGRYETCATDQSIDAVVAANDTAARGERFTFAPAELLEALDAFGTAGAYNPAALARLYAGRRVRVVRGWRARDGRVESQTLLSPYPDRTLTQLNTGTLVITWISR